VTALVGQVAYLNCRVKNLGNRTVSWVRHRDIHLLTVGRYTYTSDQRFEALHSPHTEDWQLRVKYPQRKDTGVYECQISTTPPIGHFVHLHVVGNSYNQFFQAKHLFLQGELNLNRKFVSEVIENLNSQYRSYVKLNFDTNIKIAIEIWCNKTIKCAEVESF